MTAALGEHAGVRPMTVMKREDETGRTCAGGSFKERGLMPLG
jgi:hypothetical protein